MVTPIMARESRWFVVIARMLVGGHGLYGLRLRARFAGLGCALSPVMRRNEISDEITRLD